MNSKALICVVCLLVASVGMAQTMPPPITQEQLIALQAQPDAAPLVLDVRSPEEFATGHVPGAVNIPYDKVASRLAEIPKDKDVVLYCRSGRRAGLAAETLEANGYTRLQHLQGDMEAWVKDGRPVEGAAQKPTG